MTAGMGLRASSGAAAAQLVLLVVCVVAAFWTNQGSATLVAYMDFESQANFLLMKSGTCPSATGFPLTNMATQDVASTSQAKWKQQARGNCSTGVLDLVDAGIEVKLGPWKLYETGEMSFAGWFNWDRTGQLTFIRSSGSSIGLGMTTVDPGGLRYLQFTFPNVVELFGTQPINVTLGAWMHFGFSYSYPLASFYLNGELRDTIVLDSVPAAQPSEEYLTLGVGPGLADDIMIFQTALGADDFNALYTGEYWADADGGCPPVQLPSVSSPPANGPVLNTTVQTGFTYQGAGAPAIPSNPIEYAWAETNDAGCTSTDIPNAASPNVTARILALTPSLTFSFWVRESYPFRAFQYCSIPGSVQVLVSGDVPRITDLTSSINNLSNNTVEVFLGETAVLKVATAGFPAPYVTWLVLGTNTLNTTTWLPVTSGSTLSLTNPTNASLAKRSAGARVRRVDIPADGTNTTRYYQVLVQNAAGKLERNLTVVSYSAIRPSPSPSPSPSTLPSSSDDGKTIALAVGLSVGLSGLCLLLLLVAAVILFLRFRGPKEFRVVPHKPDFDRLAFGTILAQDSPHLDRDQTRHAKQLEKLLCDESFAVAAVVCDQMKATDSENVSKALTYVFAGNDVAVEAIKFFVTKEVLVSSREGTLFRANSVPTKLFSCYCRIVGLEYLWSVFALPVTELNVMAVRAEGEDRDKGSEHSSYTTTLLGPVAFEVDPTKMEEASDQSVNTIQLWLVAQKLLSSLMRAIGTLPKELQDILRHVYHEVREKFNEEAANKAIGGFLFLRFVCPALMAPQVYGLLKEPPHSTAQRQLILIAKVLQNLANDTLPGKKEGYMERLNMFITTNQEPLKHYYRNLIEGHDGPSGARAVPEDVMVKVTTHMHAHIYPNLDKITSALDASEHADHSAPLRECVEGMGEPEADFA